MSADVVFLHGLGLSGRVFDPVAALLPDARVVAVDLPGHGEDSAVEARDAVGTAEFVEAVMREHGVGDHVLVGHSMGGKIATLVARRAVLGPPQRVVLLAPSPPTPEPMAQERRLRMLSWVDGDRAISADHAREFVDENVGAALGESRIELLVDDIRRTSPAAWRRWLTRGSAEDISTLVGALDVPARILGGTEDADLGAEAQPRLHRAAYPRAEYIPVAGAGHLLTIEPPAVVADAIGMP
jgi:pimeloyl-ACP methyl ester carboxylesterase